MQSNTSSNAYAIPQDYKNAILFGMAHDAMHAQFEEMNRTLKQQKSTE